MLRRMDELGGPTTFNHYPIGWAHAMDTPFQWTKQIASHFGGTRNGMVISWPARIKDKGGIRTQFHHVHRSLPDDPRSRRRRVAVDAQRRAAEADRRREHGLHVRRREGAVAAPTQYFEMLGNRAIYHDGWVAATTPPTPPWAAVARRRRRPRLQVGALQRHRRLQRKRTTSPRRSRPSCAELQDLFWVEAAKYNVLPIDNSKVERLDTTNRPSLTRGRYVFTYYPGPVRIPEGAAPDMKNKSFQIAASVEIPAGRRGRHAAHAGRSLRGLGPVRARRQARLLLQPRRRRALLRHRQGRARCPASTPSSWTSQYDGPGLGKGGTATLLVDGKPAGERHARAHAGLPHVARRDARLRRGHRHARQRGLPACRSASPARSTGSRSASATPRSRPKRSATFDAIRGRGVMAE